VSHRGAIITIASATVLDALGGVAFAAVEHLPVTTGLYWSVVTATTVGFGDVVPTSPTARLISVFVMLTVIPLFSATFSLFTAGLQAGHLGRAESRITDHVASVRDGFHEALSERLTALHNTVEELQHDFGNGLLAEFHERLDAVADHLHERLDGLESALNGEQPVPVVITEPEEPE